MFFSRPAGGLMVPPCCTQPPGVNVTALDSVGVLMTGDIDFTERRVSRPAQDDFTVGGQPPAFVLLATVMPADCFLVREGITAWLYVGTASWLLACTGRVRWRRQICSPLLNHILNDHQWW